MRRARFPVVKGIEGYDFANVKLPDGYSREELTAPRTSSARRRTSCSTGATGRGKSHLATALGVMAVEPGH
jgi:DNA replication protein DnaC